MKRGFILKADINRMVLTGGEDLDKIDQLAFDFFKAIEARPLYRRIVVLPRLVSVKRREAGTRPRFFGFLRLRCLRVEV